MKISRREWLAGASAGAIFRAVPAEAFWKGMARKQGLVVLNGFDAIPNDSYLYKNFLKGCSSQTAGTYAYQQNLDANGYPTVGTLGADFSWTFVKPPSYTGNWRLSWKGKLSLRVSPSQAPNTGFTIISDPSGVVTNGSTTMTIVGGGSSSTVTTVDFSYNGVGTTTSIIFQNAGNFTGLSDMRLFRTSAPYTADGAALDAGLLVNCFNSDFIADLVALNPPIIRPLDISPVNFSLLTSSVYANQATNFTWESSAFNAGSWAGTASSVDSGTTFTCAAAPNSPAGAYVDGETIQVQFAIDGNVNPTLNVNGRGAGAIKSFAFGTPGVLPYTAQPSGDSRRIIGNAFWTLIWNASAACWCGTNSGQVVHAPLSVRVAMCNAIGKDFWWLIPLLYDNTSVTAELTYIRDNLNSGLNCWPEVSNEVWNSGFTQTNMATCEGAALGFSASSNRQYQGYYALRLCQIIDLITPTWTATRSASQLRPLLLHQNAGGADTVTYRFNGTDLGAFGYSTAGNRPADKVYGLGSATYISGSLIRNGSYSTGYSAGDISGLTGASDNYASGVPSQMSSALDWIDNDCRAGTKNGSLGGGTIGFVVGTNCAAWNTDYAGYGKPAICYEGNYEGLAPTTAQCTSVFGIATSYSAEIQTLITAYKNDSRLAATMAYMYAQFFALSQSKYGASYTFSSSAQWGLLTGDLYSSRYQTYSAMVTVNN